MISVVIPLFNKEYSIQRAIRSVLCQLEPGDEIVVVDDGSTDDSQQRCLEISDPRIKCIYQSNMGASAARNKGWSASANKYIAFLDADDWWEERARENFIHLIKRFPNSNMYCLAHRRVDEFRAAYVPNGISEAVEFTGELFIRQYGHYSGLVHSSSVCVKQEIIARVGGFPVGARSGEDITTWIAIALEGKVCASPAIGANVERDMSGKLKGHVREARPYHYVAFCDKKFLDSLSVPNSRALMEFMLRNAIRQIAGCVLAGKRRYGWERAKSLGAVNPLFFVIGLIVMLLPRKLLLVAFRRKYKLEQNPDEAHP